MKGNKKMQDRIAGNDLNFERESQIFRKARTRKMIVDGWKDARRDFPTGGEEVPDR